MRKVIDRSRKVEAVAVCVRSSLGWKERLGGIDGGGSDGETMVEEVMNADEEEEL